MRRNRLAIWVLAALFCGNAVKVQAEVIWGEAKEGMAVGIDVEGGREFHPGEGATVRGYWKLAKGKLPSDAKDSAGQLHVIVPGGKEYVNNGPGKRGEAAVVRRWEDAEGRERTCAERYVKWTYGETSWVAVGAPPWEVLSFREVGTYRFWVEAKVSATGAPADGWRGEAKSPVVEVVLGEMPAEKRLAKPTAEQEKNFGAWLDATKTIKNEFGVTEGIDAWLGREIQKTINEGLARRLVEEAKAGGEAATRAQQLLSLRMGSLRDPGIDGPYLKEWALWDLENLEKSKELTQTQVEVPMVYARLHPEDKAVMERFAAVAKRFSKLPVENRAEIATTRPIPSEPGMTLDYAWRILQLTGALKEAMSVAEARDLLGTPTFDDGATMAWRVQWMMELAPPQLRAKVKEGKLVEWSGSGPMFRD